MKNKVEIPPPRRADDVDLTINKAQGVTCKIYIRLITVAYWICLSYKGVFTDVQE